MARILPYILVFFASTKARSYSLGSLRQHQQRSANSKPQLGLDGPASFFNATHKHDLLSLPQQRKAWLKNAPPAKRGLVLVKLARTGSSWFMDSLKAFGAYCDAREEVTNDAQGNCTQARDAIQAALRCEDEGMRGAISLNILKFTRGVSMACEREQVDAIRAALPEPPLMVTLLRRNCVQAAASKLFANTIAPLLSPTCGKFHINTVRCNEKDLQIASQSIPLDPAELLRSAQKYENETIFVRGKVQEIAGELGTQLYHSTTEEMLEAGGGTSFAIPTAVGRWLGLHGLNDTMSESRASNRNMHEVDDGEPKLMSTIANFDEVHRYFKTYASSTHVKMLTSTT